MAKKPATQIAPKTFETAVAELEQILADMENEQVGLEESLGKYERGTYLLQWCRGVLGEAEKKIEFLSQGPQGTLQTATDATPANDTDSGVQEA